MNHLKCITSVRLCIILILFLLTGYSCRNSMDDKTTVLKGKFIQSVIEPGELEAIRATSVIMPKINYRYGYSFKLVGIAEHGAIVNVGDSIAALDPSSIYKYIILQEEALENAMAKAEKQKVESDISRRDLEVQFKNEEASYNLKKLELERMQFESQGKKKIKELEVEKARMKLDKVKKKLALHPLLGRYDHLVNELQITQCKSDIENAKEVLKSMVLFSPGNGYFQHSTNRRTGQSHKLGDEIYMGSMIASIPDVSNMKARSFINETEFSKVREGMRVVIRLDALPDVSFEGTVRNISSICLEKDERKVFTTEISILENDPRLKPGMSVSCEYICYEFDDQLYVPNECILSEGGETFIFINKGRKFEKTKVTTGISNARHTIIHTRLKPGRALLSVDKESDR
jgi:HlyD family secretion protein